MYEVTILNDNKLHAKATATSLADAVLKATSLVPGESSMDTYLVEIRKGFRLINSAIVRPLTKYIDSYELMDDPWTRNIEVKYEEQKENVIVEQR